MHIFFHFRYHGNHDFLFLAFLNYYSSWTGWSGDAMVLGKLPVSRRPIILITVGQGLLHLQ